MKSKITTPHGSVLIWNYIDRVDSTGGTFGVHDVEPIIVATESVISMTTSKSKSSSSGNFEIRLAPHHNWVARITPGSWCSINMSQYPISSKTADEHSLKMIGRIDAVRCAVEVDQSTGARATVFVVTGQDWGGVFDTILYIDTNVAENILTSQQINQAYTILGLNMYQGYSDGKPLPSPSELINTIINLWGTGTSGTAIQNGEKMIIEAGKPHLTKIQLSSRAQFQLPSVVAQYMGQSPPSLSPLEISTSQPVVRNFGELIKRQTGVLVGPDKYKEIKESLGIPDPAQFFGKHTLWAMLTEQSNTALYELVNDIRWENGKPSFTLYHRVRPFVNDSNFLTNLGRQDADAFKAKLTVSELTSLFKHIKQIPIPYEEVVNINYGTNWRDKVNFIEVVPTSQLVPQSLSLAAKTGGQTTDHAGYERDGFKPLMVQCPFVPYDTQGNKPEIQMLTHWKFLMREWYFNTHLMLNGAVTLIGQSQYIQVGDNIKINSQVLGNAPINSAQSKAKKTFLLAHVENVAHSFSVNQETGARTFTTNIQFVRGIITDSDGNIVAPIFGVTALDRDGSKIPKGSTKINNVL